MRVGEDRSICRVRLLLAPSDCEDAAGVLNLTDLPTQHYVHFSLLCSTLCPRLMFRRYAINEQERYLQERMLSSIRSGRWTACSIVFLSE